MLTRISNSSSYRMLNSRLSLIQSRISDNALKLGSQQQSQDYMGLSSDVFRLLNTETNYNQVKNYSLSNTNLETRLKAMNQVTEGVTKGVKDLQKRFIDFRSHNGTPSPEYMEQVAQLRDQAQKLLNDFQYYLNQKTGNGYIFGGGTGNRPPVSLPVDSLETFSSIYNGNTVTYPQTRAANLFRNSFSNMQLEFNNGQIGGKDYGSISTGPTEPSRFITGSISNAGTIQWYNSVSNPTTGVSEGRIESSVAGAFSGLTTGSTLLMGSGVNQGVYTVTEVSEDGRSIKITPPPPTNASEAPGVGGYTMSIGVPNGTTIKVQNSTGNDTHYTVRWPDNQDLNALGPAAMAAIINGQVLFTTPQFATTTLPGQPQPNISIQGEGYYQGDSLPWKQRIDESRTVTVDVNGQNAAFEKGIRAAGLIAQGLPKDSAGNIDLDEFYRRTEEALALISDAVSHDPTVREDPSDLTHIGTVLGLTTKFVVDAKNAQTSLLAALEGDIVSIKGVKNAELLAKLNSDNANLEAFSRIIAEIQQTSLLKYL